MIFIGVLADIGWITGHSYIIYGPLSNGATTLMFEGVPNYPTFSRFWEIVDKHQVNIFYTAPTAIRALMREKVMNLSKKLIDPHLSFLVLLENQLILKHGNGILKFLEILIAQ